MEEIKIIEKGYLISLHSVYSGARKVLTYVPHQFSHRTSHAPAFLVALGFHITGVQPSDSAEIWGCEEDKKIMKKHYLISWHYYSGAKKM